MKALPLIGFVHLHEAPDGKEKNEHAGDLHWPEEEAERGGVHNDRKKGKAKFGDGGNTRLGRLKSFVVNKEGSEAGGNRDDNQKEDIPSRERGDGRERLASRVQYN